MLPPKTLWSAADRILDQALDLDRAQRSEFLARACVGQPELHQLVEGLLEADAESSRFLEGLSLDFPDIDLVEPGVRIGPYRIVGPLGQGGMGQVYLARRDDDEYEATVAIKLLPAELVSEDLGHRFRTERQILAEMHHPNIARLYDGGTTADGRPFLVMEFVDGRPIDQYCEELQLDCRERARVLLALCEAVAYAHARLLVHRDLKPDNVLVTSAGELKLLDFGIAKTLSSSDLSDTSEGSRALTPHYASPEQLRGETETTATDVYSLGVLLANLVAEAPSTTGETEDVPADLQAVVGKATRVDPAGRYPTAAALQADLERFLTDRPVDAMAPTWAYRLGKFVQRNRGAVLSWSLVGLAILGLITAAGRQTQELRKQRTLARAEGQRAESQEELTQETVEFLLATFRPGNPAFSEGDLPSARQILELAAQRVADFARGEPLLHSFLLNAVGDAYLGMGLPHEALRHHGRALEVRTEALGRLDESSTQILVNLAYDHFWLGQPAEGRGFAERAVEAREALYGRDHGETAKAVSILATHLQDTGEFVLASDLHRRSLVARGQSEEGSWFAGEGLFHLGTHLLEVGAYDEAEARLRASLEVLGQRTHPNAFWNDYHLARAQKELGTMLNRTRRFTESRPVLLESLETYEKWYGERHVILVKVLEELGRAHRGVGDYRSAIAYYERALGLFAPTIGESHPHYPVVAGALAESLAHGGRLDDARRAARIASAGERYRFAAVDSSHLHLLGDRALTAKALGEHGAAAALSARCHERLRELDRLQDPIGRACRTAAVPSSADDGQPESDHLPAVANQQEIAG